MTDEEIMNDFIESVSYVGDVRDWRDEPLTEESEDEPEGDGAESFTCLHCGIRRYHLPGQHDQCDHSITGECIEQEATREGPRAPLFHAERQIAGIKVQETAIAFDADGKELLHKKGEQSSVSFTPAETAKLKNAIFTHNHPSARGFSNPDLYYASQANVSEMRAVGTHAKEGKITYVIKRPKEGWPKSDEMWDKILYWDRRLRSRLVPLLNAGRITDDGASRAHGYALAALIAKDIGAEYRAIRIRPHGTR